jgi:hypothetical protein
VSAFVLDPKNPNCEHIRECLHKFIDQLPRTKAWEWTWRPFQKKRSDKQRKALFGAAYKPIMEFMGLRGEDDKEELHRFFCGEFWGWAKDGPFSSRRPARTTTKNERGERDEIDTKTALEFYAFIQQKAAEQGIYVPDPDPLYREQEAEKRRAA